MTRPCITRGSKGPPSSTLGGPFSLLLEMHKPYLEPKTRGIRVSFGPDAPPLNEKKGPGRRASFRSAPRSAAGALGPYGPRESSSRPFHGRFTQQAPRQGLPTGTGGGEHHPAVSPLGIVRSRARAWSGVHAGDPSRKPEIPPRTHCEGGTQLVAPRPGHSAPGFSHTTPPERVG